MLLGNCLFGPGLGWFRLFQKAMVNRRVARQIARSTGRLCNAYRVLISSPGLSLDAPPNHGHERAGARRLVRDKRRRICAPPRLTRCFRPSATASQLHPTCYLGCTNHRRLPRENRRPPFRDNGTRPPRSNHGGAGGEREANNAHSLRPPYPQFQHTPIHSATRQIFTDFFAWPPLR